MSRPGVFAEEGFEGATRLAGDGRWLIVDATAAWCQPCKLMDRTTWADPAVVSWVEAHAVAIQVDVDADVETARTLAIGAMPTVIAFRDGQERDRVVGYRNAAGLLEWLNGLAHGETSLDRMRKLLPSTGEDVQGRLGLARALLHGRRPEEAAEEYVWLWQNMIRLDPGMVGVRVSFMAGEMAALVTQYPKARPRFAALRDQAGGLASQDPAATDARLDWIVLNEVLGDDASTVAWFDTIKDQPAGAPGLERLAHRLVPKLQALGRWADIGRLYADPLGELLRAHQLLEPEGLPPEMLDQVREVMAHHFREQAALMVASLRAAGRNEESAAIEREAMERDPGDEMREAIARTLRDSDAPLRGA